MVINMLMIRLIVIVSALIIFPLALLIMNMCEKAWKIIVNKKETKKLAKAELA